MKEVALIGLWSWWRLLYSDLWAEELVIAKSSHTEVTEICSYLKLCEVRSASAVTWKILKYLWTALFLCFYNIWEMKQLKSFIYCRSRWWNIFFCSLVSHPFPIQAFLVFLERGYGIASNAFLDLQYIECWICLESLEFRQTWMILWVQYYTLLFLSSSDWYRNQWQCSGSSYEIGWQWRSVLCGGDWRGICEFQHHLLFNHSNQASSACPRIDLVSNFLCLFISSNCN